MFKDYEPVALHHRAPRGHDAAAAGGGGGGAGGLLGAMAGCGAARGKCNRGVLIVAIMEVRPCAGQTRVKPRVVCCFIAGRTRVDNWSNAGR